MFFKQENKPRRKGADEYRERVEELIQRIALNDPTLKQVEFTITHPLFKHEIQQLAQGIRSDSYLQTLKISDVYFDQETLTEFREAILSSKSLTKIELLTKDDDILLSFQF